MNGNRFTLGVQLYATLQEQEIEGSTRSGFSFTLLTQRGLDQLDQIKGIQQQRKCKPKSVIVWWKEYQSRPHLSLCRSRAKAINSKSSSNEREEEPEKRALTFQKKTKPL